jgi:hypothetical protein
MPRGLISDEKEIEKIGDGGHTGGEASARVFRSPSTNFRKKHVELSSLFLSVLIYL